jgi:hypothetical protein
MSVLIAFRNTECRTLIEVEEEKRRAKEELIKLGCVLIMP